MNIRIRTTWLLSIALVATLATISAVRLPAQAPGATVTAVDAKTGLVTAKVNSTGQVFTFTLVNKAPLTKVRPGQGVFVNLGKKQVSLDGKQPQGTILTLLPLGIKPAGSSSASSGSNPSGSSGNSGGSTTSGNSNPQPVSGSCGGTSNPLTSDTCAKSAAAASNVGSVGCGASITVTGNTFPAATSDYLMFTVPASRANCVDYSGHTPSPYIQVRITSNPTNVIVFDGLLSAAGNPIPLGWGAPNSSLAQSEFSAGLGTNYSPLTPGAYLLRIHGINASTTGTWTLTITG